MSRSTTLTGAAVAAILLATAAIAGPGSNAAADVEIEAFDVATIGIETGSLAPDGSRSDSTDFEIQWFADYTGVVSWNIEDPAGNAVFTGALAGSAAQQAASELTFASRPNHPYAPDEYPGETLESFFERYPEGDYTFTGTTDDGTIVRSTAHLTHDIPAHPDVKVRVKRDDVRLVWRRISDCFGDAACEHADIVEYSIKISEAAETRDDFTDGAFTNGDARFTETHYVPEQICGKRACRVEVDDEFFVPGNTYEVQVFAIEASGNSTYRELELTYPTRRR